ncbi:MAG TPA: aldo/keto reductase, partial [Bacteroidota bacterium]
MTEIPKRALGRTGLRTTLIGFGALEIGRDWGVGSPQERRRPDEAEAGDTLRCVLGLGVNLIDTASAYHRSEERVGKSVHDRRNEFILATKCGEHNKEPDTYYDFSYGAVRDSISTSFRLLQTNVIDILQIHFGPDPDKVLDDGGCVRAMKEAKASGSVRFLGASVNGTVLDRCIESGDFDVVQVGYSLLNQTEADRISKAKARGIGVLIRSGLAGGWLTSRALGRVRDERPAGVNLLFDLCGGDAKLVTALALQFISRNDGVSSILIGSKSCENVSDAIRLAASAVDAGLLEKAAKLARD